MVYGMAIPVAGQLLLFAFRLQNTGFEVKPMGCEPTPSAVQSQIQEVVAVRWCSEIPAKSPFLSLAAFTSVRRFSCGLVYYWCTSGEGLSNR
jgi:hypothetical protein